MRRKFTIANAWPLLNRFLASRTISKYGGLLPSSSTPHWLNMPVSTACNLHLHGINREQLNFKSLDLRGSTITRAERTTERPWRDTLLSSPGTLSVDAEAQHLFIADTKHHRIIIADGDGKIVDCIGSSPGMEDGTFEKAQLCYPGSVVVDADQNFLYIADSENHVIRRANLSTRTLSTVSPTKSNCESTTWGRFLRWMGALQPSESEQDSKKEGKYDSLRYPWHLKFAQRGLLVVASRRFENVWELDRGSGQVTESQFHDSEVASEEFCRRAIDVEEMEDVHSLILHEMKGRENPWQISSVPDIVSRVVKLHNKLLFIDTECQIIRKFDLDTGSHDTLYLSNLGLLGLPSWWPLPSMSFQSTDCVNVSDNLAESTDREADRLGNPIYIQPGRCLLCISPILPTGMVWAAPIEDGSIWRQAKGSIVELSLFGGSLTSHKISSAQQWVDDLDDLDNPNSDTLETEELTLPPQSDSGIPFYTLVDASLGTGEVIIDAALHLKYVVSQESQEEFSDPVKGTDKEVALGDQIFLKRLLIKVRFEIETSAPEERTKHITVSL